MERDDIPDGYNFFEIGYCGHPDLPYAHIQLEQPTKLITSHFREGYHPLIYDPLATRGYSWFDYSLFTYLRKKNLERI